MSHFRIASFFFASILVLAIGIALAAPPPERDSKSANARAGDSLSDEDKPAKSNKIEKTDAEWMKVLSREQFRVARKGGLSSTFGRKRDPDASCSAITRRNSLRSHGPAIQSPAAG